MQFIVFQALGSAFMMAAGLILVFGLRRLREDNLWWVVILMSSCIFALHIYQPHSRDTSAGGMMFVDAIVTILLSVVVRFLFR